MVGGDESRSWNDVEEEEEEEEEGERRKEVGNVDRARKRAAEKV